METGALSPDTPQATSTAPPIAGLSTLKGLVLYGAVLTFAGLYGDFIVKISGARPGAPPPLDATLVATAAALAGVLGAAFALEIGTTTDGNATNQALGAAVARIRRSSPARDGAGDVKEKALARAWQVLSLDPESVGSASWPKTFGIWVYAIVASGVAITYVLNQNETPAAIKALAVAFGGYVIALVTAAYKSA